MNIPDQESAPAPQRVVWEITWRCNLRCQHCLVKAGKASNELTTAEALAVADSLAHLGLGAVTLTGGEPLMRKDWPQIAQRLVSHGDAHAAKEVSTTERQSDLRVSQKAFLVI
ncbi:MAG: radical SAM protein [Proteobacteria bacterium]|jgi:MoaA/NifB/PqqE/SkfB family radical SAM enzyme|nr:radical SAM protein [Pseudomonadota bacterium]